ncbi:MULTISPECIES: hypothetical protein [unclassified Streptomyces]|uniref:hypothetical protein n=1 Tax=unclassified Streptomyces TaxID=2593676 RepID=UPI000DD6380C|nr:MULTISPECIES: hypothetical protein [unclassified Streptomyces]QZZ26561.1 hypothetical protein A7X85_10095 [Streptomyces sp. ST1015]
MPIYLPAPAHRPGGPDGQGWNRIALGSLAGDQCALRPRDYSHFRESQDTRRARYGGYGPCIADGKCDTCPILRSAPHTLTAFDDRILVRIHPVDGRPYLMNRPEDGWASLAKRWAWQDLARLDGWEIGRRYEDEHGQYFWIERVPPEPAE